VQAAGQAGAAAITDAAAEQLLRVHGIPCSGPEHRAGAVQSTGAAASLVDGLITNIDLFLRELPHHVGCEIIDSGIWLSGGGALIPGIRERLEERIGISVRVVRNPMFAVIEGARGILPVVAALNQWR
jgi:rod shape-determining protein MreB